jgi:polar amino acid transport system substrate-binding protein
MVAISAHADALDSILESKTLRVGVSLFEPWTLKSESGELSGFEIDVANRLAQDMGVTAEFRIYEWDQIISGLVAGEIDVIAGGMAITPSRALKINFSIPYAESGITLVTNSKKTRDLSSLKDVNDSSIVIAAVSGSASEELVESLFDQATLLSVKTGEEGRQAVLDGNAHALVASTPQPEFLALLHPDKLDLPLSKPLLTYRTGLGVAKGEQEFLNFLNAWITARDADNWLEATHDHWFESLDWRPQSQ